jgi:galactokinase/mevalonate kinase-like predicted kinase
MIISRTPFRISFFGGGTDYPAWYRKYGGSVLVSTIDKYCYLACRYYPPFFEHSYRISYIKSENCQSIEEISHPAVKGILPTWIGTAVLRCIMSLICQLEAGWGPVRHLPWGSCMRFTACGVSY